MTISAEKTWNFIHAVAQESGADLTNQVQLFNVKQGLISGLGAWTVAGSSDASTAGMDAVDRWVDYTNVVFSTGNHSWIVLEQSGIGSGFQVLIQCDYSSSATENIHVFVSYTGAFTGGTISARPTAIDEVALHSGLWSSGTNARYSTYVAKSSDGECSRVFFFRDGVFNRIWFLDAPKNPEAYWTQQWYGTIAASPSLSNFHGGSNLTTEISSTVVELFCNCEGQLGFGGLIERDSYQVPDRAGNWYVCPITFMIDSFAIRGLPGSPYDLWLIPQSLPTGEYMRGVGSPFDFVVLQPFLVPWDGNPVIF